MLIDSDDHNKEHDASEADAKLDDIDHDDDMAMDDTDDDTDDGDESPRGMKAGDDEENKKQQQQLEEDEEEDEEDEEDDEDDNSIQAADASERHQRDNEEDEESDDDHDESPHNAVASSIATTRPSRMASAPKAKSGVLQRSMSESAGSAVPEKTNTSPDRKQGRVTKQLQLLQQPLDETQKKKGR